MATNLTSNIMEIMEPESSLYHTLMQRSLDIPKYECTCSIVKI